MSTTLTSRELDLTRFTMIVTGAPYTPGDPVSVEYFGVWREATVEAITTSNDARFGLRWFMRVTLRDTDDTLYVKVDDNGRNHTYRALVRPSNVVSE
jgi:hypothetical protein